jgi:hypothetical protein
MTGESPQGFLKSLGVALFINKNQAMFNGHAGQPGHIVHVQLGHQVGPVPLGWGLESLWGYFIQKLTQFPAAHQTGLRLLPPVVPAD